MLVTVIPTPVGIQNVASAVTRVVDGKRLWIPVNTGMTGRGRGGVTLATAPS